jgi:hypothetical protein
MAASPPDESCHDRLDEIARRKQPLVIKKRGSYASIFGEFTT